MKVFHTDDSVLLSTALSLFVVAGKTKTSHAGLAVTMNNESAQGGNTEPSA